MLRLLCATAAALLVAANDPTFAARSPWGANYFPNVPLVTETGKAVHFFADLIENKIVVINFIYTRCPDTCPLETAQLINVQRILGDRLGKDVFFYSITIDPEHDTPAVLKAYKEKFGARWTFLSGNHADITKLRKKLGLYIAEIQDGSNNHNVSMIIGNQATGRWMKRSPFENPYVLADQIGNWLTGWKSPPRGDDYASAPALRKINRGEQLYRTRCASCHSLTGAEPEGALGPDLLGVTQRREMDWLLRWLKAPDQMLENKDPIALALYQQYNQLAMPNMRLNKQEALDLIDYIDSASAVSVASTGAASTLKQPKSTSNRLVVENARVRQPYADAKVSAGYMTLLNNGSEDVTLVNIESDIFGKIEVHEMAMVDGLMTMREVTQLVIPAHGHAFFKPGGKHLMLLEPQRQLSRLRKIELVLTFASGKQQSVSARFEKQKESIKRP